MKVLKIIAIATVSILGSLAFIGWLAPQPARSEGSKTVDKQEEMVKPIAAARMVSSSQVVDWNGLPETIKQKVGEYQSYYLNGSWEQRNAVPFKRESAYYVKLILNNQQLAKFSESEAFPADQAITDNPFMLYGKYKNRWAFDGLSGIEILPTEKFRGFTTIAINRTGNTDEVWVGPIEEKPGTLRILSYQERDKVYKVDLK
jgi:hypothetical protein